MAYFRVNKFLPICQEKRNERKTLRLLIRPLFYILVLSFMDVGVFAQELPSKPGIYDLTDAIEALKNDPHTNKADFFKKKIVAKNALTQLVSNGEGEAIMDALNSFPFEEPNGIAKATADLDKAFDDFQAALAKSSAGSEADKVAGVTEPWRKDLEKFEESYKRAATDPNPKVAIRTVAAAAINKEPWYKEFRANHPELTDDMLAEGEAYWNGLVEKASTSAPVVANGTPATPFDSASAPDVANKVSPPPSPSPTPGWINADQLFRAERRIEASFDQRFSGFEQRLGAFEQRFDTFERNVDQRFRKLHREVEHNRREANEGIALSLATANLRYVDEPGVASFAMGGGYWLDQTGMAIGVGYTTPSGNLRFNASLAGAPGSGNLGAGVGVSLRLN